MTRDTQGLILSYMSEGLMVIGKGGIIELVNDAALAIFEKTTDNLTGNVFARVFFEEDETGANDEFRQSVLDAIYDKGQRLEKYTPYTVGDKVKQLRIVSSYMREEDASRVILVISDITELTEMRDAVKAMNRISSLNKQLEIRNKVLQETFGKYLSDEIVKQILDTPDGWKLGGQKCLLTVMMTDLRGFTAMCERMKPTDLIDMLNHYFSEMCEEFARYNGTLIEFLGDGMLIIFGAPIMTKNHASDAVAAAIAMQKRMKRVNEWNAEHGYEQLSMGIGINTDEVILGNIGSENRIRYGVIGAPVNLAGRIESYTTEGQILVSPDTLGRIKEDISVVKEFKIMPKGVKKELTISQIDGIGGPYEQFLEREKDRRIRLDSPKEVTFYPLDGKHVSDTSHTGYIYEISDKCAVLTAHTELSEYDNIRIDIGEDLYAKVTETKDGRFIICFTAKPESFTGWLSSITK